MPLADILKVRERGFLNSFEFGPKPTNTTNVKRWPLRAIFRRAEGVHDINDVSLSIKVADQYSARFIWQTFRAHPMDFSKNSF